MFYLAEGNLNNGWQTDVSREELGIMKGVDSHIMKRVETHIQILDGTTPRYFKPWSLAYALQGTVIRKIKQLQTVISIVPEHIHSGLYPLLQTEDGWKHLNMWRLQSSNKTC